MGFTLRSGKIQDLDSPDAHMALVRSQWRDFAAFAWRRYLAEGRGALVVDLTNVSKLVAGLGVPIYFVADGSERLAKRGGWPNKEIAESVKEYDPERDVVLVFLRLDGDSFCYNVSDEVTPPSAFEAMNKAQ